MNSLTIATVLFVITSIISPSAGAVHAAAPPPGTLDVRGTWAWSCSGGRFSGRWEITSQDASGRISGRFLETNANDIGTIDGVVSGNSIEFERQFTWDGRRWTQHWRAELVYGSMYRIETTGGTWDGAYGESVSHDFYAKRE
jgi:hypothetical protein